MEEKTGSSSSDSSFIKRIKTVIPQKIDNNSHTILIISGLGLIVWGIIFALLYSNDTLATLNIVFGIGMVYP